MFLSNYNSASSKSLTISFTVFKKRESDSIRLSRNFKIFKVRVRLLSLRLFYLTLRQVARSYYRFFANGICTACQLNDLSSTFSLVGA